MAYKTIYFDITVKKLDNYNNEIIKNLPEEFDVEEETEYVTFGVQRDLSKKEARREVLDAVLELHEMLIEYC